MASDHRNAITNNMVLTTMQQDKQVGLKFTIESRPRDFVHQDLHEDFDLTCPNTALTMPPVLVARQRAS